jgi:hypothetical protein
LRSERGGFTVLDYYGLMHLAGFLDRRGIRRIADRVRRWIPLARIELGCSTLLRGDFQFVVTEGGGCAVDIDNEHDYDVAAARYEEWRKDSSRASSSSTVRWPLPASVDPERRA